MVGASGDVEEGELKATSAGERESLGGDANRGGAETLCEREKLGMRWGWERKRTRGSKGERHTVPKR